MPWGIALGAAGILGGSLISSNASSNAAATQARAAQQALQFQKDQYYNTQSNLSPFLGAGVGALNALQNPSTAAFLYANPVQMAGQNPQIGNLQNQPQFNFPQYQPLTAQSFQSSPGYQWQLGQGINAIQNSAAGKTGAVSGNTLQALQGYGTGLAQQDWYNANALNSNNYATQLQSYLDRYNAQNQGYTQTQGYLGNAYNQNLAGIAGQQANTYNILSGLIGGGQNAGASLGGFGQQFANQAGNFLTQGANAQAAGQVGQANAFTGGINSLSSLLLSNPNAYGGGGGNNVLNYLLGGSGGGGGGANPYALNSLPDFGNYSATQY